MAIQIAKEVSEKMKELIRGWRIDVVGISGEVWQHLESLDEDPALGEMSRHPLLDRVRLYTFRIDRLPISKVVTVAYEVDDSGPQRLVRIVDFHAGASGL